MTKIVKIVLIQVLVLSLAQIVSAFSGAGSGTGANPYIITNVTQLQEMSGGLNAWYELGNDIDASSTVNWYGGQGFVPVGDSAHGFAGNFDGKGFSITGLFINRPSSDNIGLFGTSRIATIKDVNLVNPNISGNNSTGSLVGYSDSSTISDCSCSGATVKGASSNVGGLVGNKNAGTIIGCSTYSPVVTSTSSNSYYGGLLGSQNGGSLINCRSYNVTVIDLGYYIGGLVGYNYNANIDNSFADDVHINGNYYCGGLVGYFRGSCTNSHSSGLVTGNSYVGGLIGNYDNGIINNCFSWANVTGTGDSCGGLVGNLSSMTVTDCHATGRVAGNNYVGGLVGYISNSGSLTKCYATGNVQGFEQVGGLVGRNEWYSSISKSYSSGSKINGNNYVGGCVGYNANYGTISRCFSTSDANASGVDCGGFVGKSDYSITDCFATGKASGSNFVGGFAGETTNAANTANCYSKGLVTASSNFGGFAGYNSGTSSACFWDIETSTVGVSGCGTGMTTADMMESGTFNPPWNFATIWGIDGGFTYPYIMELYPACGDPWHPYPLGDLNHDCHVNFADFALFAENWLKCTAPECDVARPGAFSLTLTPECSGTSPQIRLNWTASLGVSTYDVYRGGTLYRSDLTGTQFIDTSVSTGSSYAYFVRAKNIGGTSDTPSQSATAPASCPPGGFSLTLTPECGGTNPQIRLNWTPSSGVSTYDVYRGGTLYRSDLTGTEFIDTSVSAGGGSGSIYTYLVEAKNAGGATDTTSETATALTGCGGGQTVPASIEFQPANWGITQGNSRTLQGQVLDSTGTPVPYAQLGVDDPFRQMCLQLPNADQNGQFQYTINTGTGTAVRNYVLLFSAGSAGNATLTVTVSVQPTTGFGIQLDNNLLNMGSLNTGSLNSHDLLLSCKATPSSFPANTAQDRANAGVWLMNGLANLDASYIESVIHDPTFYIGIIGTLSCAVPSGITQATTCPIGVTLLADSLQMNAATTVAGAIIDNLPSNIASASQKQAMHEGINLGEFFISVAGFDRYGKINDIIASGTGFSATAGQIISADLQGNPQSFVLAGSDSAGNTVAFSMCRIAP
jgi:hypothetical protein